MIDKLELRTQKYIQMPTQLRRGGSRGGAGGPDPPLSRRTNFTGMPPDHPTYKFGLHCIELHVHMY